MNNDIIENLKLFRDKAFCHHSHNKASKLWKEINSNYFWKDNPDYNEQLRKISIEFNHVKNGHDYKKSCLALDNEVKKTIQMIT